MLCGLTIPELWRREAHVHLQWLENRSRQSAFQRVSHGQSETRLSQLFTASDGEAEMLVERGERAFVVVRIILAQVRELFRHREGTAPEAVVEIKDLDSWRCCRTAPAR